MNERVEAAMDAHQTASRTRGIDTSGPMRAALAAADAVMFSDAAVHRAIKALYKEQTTGNPYGGLDLQVKAVIAALKGAGDE